MFKWLLRRRWRKYFGREGSREKVAEMSQRQALGELIRPGFRSYATPEIVEKALAATQEPEGQTNQPPLNTD